MKNTFAKFKEDIAGMDEQGLNKVLYSINAEILSIKSHIQMGEHIEGGHMKRLKKMRAITKTRLGEING